MWQTQEKNKYNDLYENYSYWPTNAVRNYKKFFQDYQKNAKKHFSVLDIGAGPAKGNKIAKGLGVDYTALDIAPCLAPFWKATHVCGVIASSDSIPFLDESFDVVILWDVLEHIPETGLDETIIETFRVCKERGIVSTIICLGDEREKYGDYKCHLTLKSCDWWAKLLKRYGLVYMRVTKQPDHALITGFVEK